MQYSRSTLVRNYLHIQCKCSVAKDISHMLSLYIWHTYCSQGRIHLNIWCTSPCWWHITDSEPEYKRHIRFHWHRIQVCRKCRHFCFGSTLSSLSERMWHKSFHSLRNQFHRQCRCWNWLDILNNGNSHMWNKHHSEDRNRLYMKCRHPDCGNRWNSLPLNKCDSFLRSLRIRLCKLCRYWCWENTKNNFRLCISHKCFR